MEFFIDNMWLTWLMLAVVCLIAEVSSGDLYIMCFSIGALGAAVPASVGSPLIIQLLVFAVVSAIAVFFIRPVAIRYLHRNDKDVKSNADALADRIGTVSEEIVAGGYGRVAIDGDDWKAETSETENIPVGTKVKVVGRESIIIKVVRI